MTPNEKWSLLLNAIATTIAFVGAGIALYQARLSKQEAESARKSAQESDRHAAEANKHREYSNILAKEGSESLRQLAQVASKIHSNQERTHSIQELEKSEEKQKEVRAKKAVLKRIYERVQATKEAALKNTNTMYAIGADGTDMTDVIEQIDDDALKQECETALKDFITLHESLPTGFYVNYVCRQVLEKLTSLQKKYGCESSDIENPVTESVNRIEVAILSFAPSFRSHTHEPRDSGYLYKSDPEQRILKAVNQADGSVQEALRKIIEETFHALDREKAHNPSLILQRIGALLGKLEAFKKSSVPVS